VRQVFYLYKPGSGAYTTFSGVGYNAQWTPDAKTLYVVGTDYSNNPAGIPTLFVNNVNTGWTTYALPGASTNVAITIPSVGAFLSGNPTVAHAWCPQIANAGNGTTTLVQAYPQAGSVPVQTDVLGSTIDGQHVIGVGLGGGTTPTLTDIQVNLPASLVSGACPAANTGITLNTPFTQNPLPVQASVIDQVVTSPGSDLTFITFQPAGAGANLLPYYTPGNGGSVGTVTLTGTPTAPVAGAFSLDNTLFFVSTAGDNLVHYIDVKSLTDTKQINPGLVDKNNNPVPAEFVAVKPRATT